MASENDLTKVPDAGEDRPAGGEFFGFATMLSELTDHIDRYCRRLKVEEGAGRLIRSHLTGSLTSVNDRLTEAIQTGAPGGEAEAFADAGRHLNTLIFWLGQMETMSSQAREAARTCRIRSENLAGEVAELARRFGVRAAEREEIGAERRRDFHLRSLVEKKDFEAAIMYIDTIVQMGEANENPMLSGKYRGYRDRVLQIKETVN